jgi:hypothetical protein
VSAEDTAAGQEDAATSAAYGWVSTSTGRSCGRSPPSPPRGQLLRARPVERGKPILAHATAASAGVLASPARARPSRPACRDGWGRRCMGGVAHRTRVQTCGGHLSCCGHPRALVSSRAGRPAVSMSPSVFRQYHPPQGRENGSARLGVAHVVASAVASSIMCTRALTRRGAARRVGIVDVFVAFVADAQRHRCVARQKRGAGVGRRPRVRNGIA